MAEEQLPAELAGMKGAFVGSLVRNNADETNVSNQYQGEFRTAELSPSLLKYAIECDREHSKYRKLNLVISCMDQFELDVPKLLKALDIPFTSVFLSHGPTLTDVSLYKQKK
jgi:hypothetical protein